MIAAMKIPNGQYVVVVGDQKLPGARYIINFTNERLLKVATGPESGHEILVEGPEALLVNPELKKKVWVDLQKVMRDLQLS